MKLDYEEDMRIDETALDVEWLDQGTLALKYGKHLADLHKQVAKLEERKKTMRSELILKANQFPEESCGKEKPNTADIEAYYRNHERYKKIADELIEVQYEAEFAELAKNEIVFTRRQALENLVILHGQQYFSGPSMPRNLPQEREKREERQRKVDTGIASALSNAMSRKKRSE